MRSFSPPETILLGDILDLWVSPDSNTVRPFWEGLNPFKSLIELEREIVYVCGNHDDIMKNYPLQIPSKELAHFKVHRNRYPCDELNPEGKWQGKLIGEHMIGEHTYFFLHGHQFDPINNIHSVLRASNFLGLAAAAAEGFWKFKYLGAAVFTIIIAAVFSLLYVNWLPLLLAGAAAVVEQPLAAALVLVGGWILGAIAFLGLLWLVTVGDRWYYNVFRHPVRDTGKPRREMNLLQRVMTADFEWAAQYINADVIVFGHTHHPEICTRSGKQLVNCGSWIKQDDGYDTFVYIDENGYRLFQWLDNRPEMAESRSRSEC